MRATISTYQRESLCIVPKDSSGNTCMRHTAIINESTYESYYKLAQVIRACGTAI